MRLLLINQFFAPDPAPTGQLLADVARALLQDGHSVSVICGRGMYERCDAAGDHGLGAINIRRVGFGRSFSRSYASRLWSYACFFLAALRCVMFGRRPDVVLTLTTPPLLPLTGTVARLVRGSRHVIWEMDMYPDVAVAVGLFSAKGSFDRAIGALADLARQWANRLIALGPCTRERLAARGVSLAKVTVAHNWADGRLISPRPFPQLLPLILLYSGNLGRAHDSETIGQAMSSLGNQRRFQFIFAGGGSGRAELEMACKASRVANARFLPYQDHNALADHLGRCHVGLITQKASTCGAVVPSKTYGLMAAGRPFIFIGPRKATPARLNQGPSVRLAY